jgi:hypothetical protein
MKGFMENFDQLKDFFVGLVGNLRRQRENRELFLGRCNLESALASFSGQDKENDIRSEIRVPMGRKEMLMDACGVVEAKKQGRDGGFESVKERDRLLGVLNEKNEIIETALKNIRAKGTDNRHRETPKKVNQGNLHYQARMENLRVKKMLELKKDTNKSFQKFQRKKYVRLVTKDFNQFQVLHKQDADIKDQITTMNPANSNKYSDWRAGGKWGQEAYQDFNHFTNEGVRGAGSVTINFPNNRTQTPESSLDKLKGRFDLQKKPTPNPRPLDPNSSAHSFFNIKPI